MTKLLEKAIAEISKRSTDEQDGIAALILDELADEELWDKQFTSSQSQLSQIADKVRADIKAGNVQKAGWDEL